MTNAIPIFPLRNIAVDLGNNETANATINMSSDHLQFLAANPKKAPLIFSVLDLTPDQSTCLQQAENGNPILCFSNRCGASMEKMFGQAMLFSAQWMTKVTIS
ncbi:hypothetical protein EDC96DRAFT_580398 [Choanephora cucurbitarum]|nr:hypothetical protein EDC96DRAFT_580398 [Choanephora cucurbitarum]